LLHGQERVNGDAPPREIMKYLLLVLFCVACTVLMLSQPRPGRMADAGPPSPALLDAMSSHGIEVGSAADAAADAPAVEAADTVAPAAVPDAEPQPVALSGPVPVMQPAVYHGRGR
jgi:hypothetical protein